MRAKYSALAFALLIAGCSQNFEGQEHDTRPFVRVSDERGCLWRLRLETSGYIYAYQELHPNGKAVCGASGMSASGQDPKGLEAKPASPTAEGGDAQ